MADLNERKHACVVVFGDIGRSPRMQYHSLSLAGLGFNVDIVGYEESRPHQDVLQNASIHLHLMDKLPDFGKYCPRFLTYAVKPVWQSIALLSLLLSLIKPKFVLVQNPPAIPTLPLLWFYCYIRKVDLIIDWHNYGFTILALSLGENSVLVKICHWMEGYFGSKAVKHLCVTKALQADLKSRWNIDATVLYDRPPNHFKPISLNDKHYLMKKLMLEYPQFANVTNSETRFTKEHLNGDVIAKEQRPALIISSTSWTKDEDFSLLFEALAHYDKEKESKPDLPTIVCVVTGKGPMKEFYQQQLTDERYALKSIEFVLPWLTAEEYPKMLASADLGICLHTSSSGLDLPMKVVDMFGCGLPVCAVKYNCLDELVKHEENGLVFETSKQLAYYLVNVFENFPETKILNKFRENINSNFNKHRWFDCWLKNAGPIFKQYQK